MAKFKDVRVIERDKQLVVKVGEDHGKWYVIIEDLSPDRRHHLHRVGNYIIGETAIWCSDEAAVKRAQSEMVYIARNARVD